MVDESVAAIEAQFIADADSPPRYDAIGGFCDGSLIAALVAWRNPGNRIRLLLNISGPPWDFLPPLQQLPRMISVPSLHVMGLHDANLSQDQLMGLVATCSDATVLKHEQGHAVPLLRPPMMHAVLAVLARAGADGVAAEAAGLKSWGGPELPKLVATSMVGDMDDEEHEEGDSLSLLQKSSSNHGRKAFASPLDLLSFFATFVVLIHHYQPWMCSKEFADRRFPGRQHEYGPFDSLLPYGAASPWQLPRANVTATGEGDEFTDAVCSPVLAYFHYYSEAMAIPIFALVSGLRGSFTSSKQPPSPRKAAKQALILLCIGRALQWYVGPFVMKALYSMRVHNGLSRDDPRLYCGLQSMEEARHAWWSWYFFVLAAYKAIDAAWGALKLPRRALVVLCIVTHIACSASACPWPMCAEHADDTASRSCDRPQTQSFLGWLFHSAVVLPTQFYTNFSKLWPYYCVLPMLLPEGFPDVLPLERWWAKGGQHRLEQLLGLKLQAVHIHAPRLAWLAANYVVGRSMAIRPYHRHAFGFLEVLQRAMQLMAICALLPRRMPRNLLSDAGAGALRCYLLHMLVCPLLHPHPYVFSLIWRAESLLGTRAVGRSTYSAWICHEVLITGYMLGLQVVLSQPLPLPWPAKLQVPRHLAPVLPEWLAAAAKQLGRGVHEHVVPTLAKLRVRRAKWLMVPLLLLLLSSWANRMRI